MKSCLFLNSFFSLRKMNHPNIYIYIYYKIVSLVNPLTLTHDLHPPQAYDLDLTPQPLEFSLYNLTVLAWDHPTVLGESRTHTLTLTHTCTTWDHPVCVSLCLSVCLSVCMCVSLSVCVSLCLPVCLSGCLCVSLAVCVSL